MKFARRVIASRVVQRILRALNLELARVGRTHFVVSRSASLGSPNKRRFGVGHLLLKHPDGIDDLWFDRASLLESLLVALDVDLVIDAGAHEGHFVRFLRQDVGYAGSVVSFEPVHVSFATLAAAAAADPRWLAVELGLGSLDEVLELRISRDSVFSSMLDLGSYSRSHFATNSEVTDTRHVEVRRLESWFREHRELKFECAFLKMDTQGFDSKVFAGLGDLMKKIGILQTEIAIENMYEQAGVWHEQLGEYHRAGFRPVAFFPINRDSLRLVELDVLMVNERHFSLGGVLRVGGA